MPKGSRGGSRGSSKFSKMSISEQIATLKNIQKKLTSAKSTESKAYKSFLRASGAYRAAPQAIKAQKREEQNKAHEKYIDAQEKRVNIEEELKQYTMIYQKVR